MPNAGKMRLIPLVASVKKALATWSKVTTLDRVEAAWSSLEEYFASCPKGAVPRVRSAKKEKEAVVGRGGQRSSARSGVLMPRGSCWNCGKEGHRMTDGTTKRMSELPGGKQQPTPQPGDATTVQQSSFQQSYKQGSGLASHASGKDAQQGARSCTVRPRAPFP